MTCSDRGCISYWNGRASNGSVDYSGVDFFVDEAAKDENELCSPDGSSIARDNFDLLDRFHNHYAKQCTFSLQTVRGFREEINYGELIFHSVLVRERVKERNSHSVLFTSRTRSGACYTLRNTNCSVSPLIQETTQRVGSVALPHLTHS